MRVDFHLPRRLASRIGRDVKSLGKDCEVENQIGYFALWSVTLIWVPKQLFVYFVVALLYLGGLQYRPRLV